MSGLHIGLDLDNTLIDYGDVFAQASVETGLLTPDHALTTKDEIKAHLRAGPGGEQAWMRLQGQVYGRFIGKARLYPGAAEFIRTARARGARVSIVSHKTKYGHFDHDRIHLWDAALAWLEGEGFFAANGLGLKRSDVHFRETREEKIAAISGIGCKIFVDDLPEVLNHADFPAAVTKIWFAPDQTSLASSGLKQYRSWSEIIPAVTMYFQDK